MPNTHSGISKTTGYGESTDQNWLMFHRLGTPTFLIYEAMKFAGALSKSSSPLWRRIQTLEGG